MSQTIPDKRYVDFFSAVSKLSYLQINPPTPHSMLGVIEFLPQGSQDMLILTPTLILGEGGAKMKSLQPFVRDCLNFKKTTEKGLGMFDALKIFKDQKECYEQI